MKKQLLLQTTDDLTITVTVQELDPHTNKFLIEIERQCHDLDPSVTRHFLTRKQVQALVSFLSHSTERTA